MKRLMKSVDNRVFCGVCGGIAEYFEIDPVIIRILWIIITLLGGAGVIAYIICAIVMPKQELEYVNNKVNDQDR